MVMDKRMSMAALIILLSSVVGRAVTDTASIQLNSFVYGSTSTFGGRAPNINITIVSPDKGEAYNKGIWLIFNIQAPQGYSLEHHAILFEEYLFSEVLIDCNREKVINVLNVDYHEQDNRYQIFSFDGSLNIPLSYSQGFYHGGIILPNLQAGLHNLTVWVRAEENMMSFYPFLWTALSDTVTFTVDFTVPKIQVLSPETRAYNTSEIVSNFVVNETPSWLAYSLDSQDNVTINGNFTLNGLSDGAHSMVVYANDTAGNMGKSDTVFFTVDILDLMPILVLSAIVVITVAVGLLVYFKKCKH